MSKELSADVNEAGARSLIGWAFANSAEITLTPLPFDNWRVSTKDEPNRREKWERIQNTEGYAAVEPDAE